MRRTHGEAGQQVVGVADFWPRVWKMLAASVLCGAVALGAHRWLADSPKSMVALGVAISLGLIAYVVAAQAFALPEWTTIRGRVAARFASKR